MKESLLTLTLAFAAITFSLAVRAQAYVVASSATQMYTYGGAKKAPIDFGAWEGDVYLFGPNGNKRLIDWGWVPD